MFGKRADLLWHSPFSMRCAKSSLGLRALHRPNPHLVFFTSQRNASTFAWVFCEKTASTSPSQLQRYRVRKVNEK